MEMKDKIRILRTQLNLTLEDVGTAVGVSKTTVQRWESGEIANLRRDKIAKLAAALHTTPSYLMGWSEESLAQEQPATRTSPVVSVPSLSSSEMDIIRAYRQASPDDKAVVQAVLRKYLNPSKTSADQAV